MHRFRPSSGDERLLLWTNDPLAAAQHIYLSAGFQLVAEEPHRSFGVDLVGQSFALDLSAAVASESEPP